MKIINLIAYQKSGFNQNIGDLFTSLALKNYLKRPKDSWTVGCFNNQSINLDKYDLVVLGGGGLYHPGHLQDIATKTNLFSSPTPLAIIGLGLNLESHQKITSSFKSQVKRLVNRSTVNTARDNLTVSFLKKLKLKTKLTGCPSMFLPESDLDSIPEWNLIGLNFALNHTDYYKHKSAKTLKFINSSIKPLTYNKLIICHGKAEKKLYRSLFPDSEIFFSTNPKKVFEKYKSCQLVIGMRGHSQIFSQAVGVPSLALALSPKVLEPIKMAHPNHRQLTLSLTDSLSNVNKKISYTLKHHQILVKEQQNLISTLKKSFLSTIQILHEDRRFS